MQLAAAPVPGPTSVKVPPTPLQETCLSSVRLQGKQPKLAVSLAVTVTPEVALPQEQLSVAVSGSEAVVGALHVSGFTVPIVTVTGAPPDVTFPTAGIGVITPLVSVTVQEKRSGWPVTSLATYLTRMSFALVIPLQWSLERIPMSW